MSLDTRTASPTLLRKASMNSLKNAGAVTPPRPSPSRRSSSALGINGHGTAYGKSPLSNLDAAPEEKPAVTAKSIANTHFVKELDLHTLSEDERPAETIVILHDACYGHRYSRPRTTRAGLATIVERPERIHASILGVSAAYVRLGERHAEGRYAIHPKNHPSNNPNIPFRIRKTTRKLALSSPTVTNVHGTKWMEELKIMCDGAEAKLAMNGKELVRPQMNRGPDNEPPQQFHEGDLYLCSESLNAMEGALGAVCDGVDAVFNRTASGQGPRRAFVVIRPPGHHCSASYPSGFCWLNNVHVGISHAVLSHGLTHAAIIDFDLHHGDGSQAIAWAHNSRATSLPKNAPAWKKTSIGYFSLHDINSYPCEMGDEEKVKNASICIDNAHGQNIWNVHLQPWKSEAEFWHLYETKYMVLLDKARLFLRGQTDRIRSSQSTLKPKAAIFLSAGFDASEWESSGMQRHKVNVPTEFYARIARDVKMIAAEEGCSVDGRIISVLEGGYSDRALSSGVLSHISGLAGSDPDMTDRHIDPSGLGFEIAQRTGTLSLNTQSLDNHSLPAYDPSWWSLPQLELLDLTVHPPAAPEPKKPRDNLPPTYFCSTQSFSAKMVESPKMRRSSSGVFNNGGSPRSPARPPSPPPPEVGWATAAHELSKLLIPSDRQTMSCKPEELSAEATRVRRDRQSILTPPVSAGTTPETTSSTRMSLRERKAPRPFDKIAEEQKAAAAAKTSRRKTVAGGAVLAAEKATARSNTPKPEPGYKQPTKQSSRRLSLTSNAGSVVTEAPSVMTSAGTRVPSQQRLSNRPGSSQSIRPDSSMSSRGPSIPPLAVKKTRAPVSARGDAAKSTRVSSKAPVSRKSSALNGSSEPSTDIDSLTSGIKKIRITLTTKAQREARAASATAPAKAPAEKKAASAPAAAQQVTQEAVPEPTLPKPVTPAKEHPGVQPQLSTNEIPPPLPEPGSPHPSIAARVRQLSAASNVPLPTSSPPRLSRASSIASGSTIPSQPNVFMPYQAEGAAAKPGSRDEKLMWPEPNTSTPTASPMRKGELPVFSSTGVIPFGVKREKAEKGEADIWEVPETPEN
jgi:histone deacetylase HOS3